MHCKHTCTIKYKNIPLDTQQNTLIKAVHIFYHYVLKQQYYKTNTVIVKAFIETTHIQITNDSHTFQIHASTGTQAKWNACPPFNQISNGDV